MAEDILKVERHPNYVTITLNRPEKRNSLNAPMIEALDRGLTAIEQDREVRALVIRGEGRSFCSGIDLAEAAAIERGNAQRMFARLKV